MDRDDSTMDDLLWDIDRLAKLKPLKKNTLAIEQAKTNRMLHGIAVESNVWRHAFYQLLAMQK